MILAGRHIRANQHADGVLLAAAQVQGLIIQTMSKIIQSWEARRPPHPGHQYALTEYYSPLHKRP